MAPSLTKRGLAAMTAVAAAYGAGRLGDLPALTDGFSAAFLGAAAIAAAGALLAAVTLRAPAAATEKPDATNHDGAADKAVV
ncbi:hypothetical protein V6U90_31135 [Micromonospora sp. CPCC 206060]|uniref:hypothetical protein n=1 Tax=Micromonospora sp. CPCC 206060 TaxID=3122406 RepID=UPI002FF1DFA9